jgi:hypothetical protein
MGNKWLSIISRKKEEKKESSYRPVEGVAFGTPEEWVGEC